MKISQFTFALIGILISVYLLSIGSAFLIPLVLALVFTYGILGISNMYRAIPFGEFRLPEWFTLILSVLTWGVLISQFGGLLIRSLNEIATAYPLYEERFGRIMVDLSNQLDLRLPTTFSEIFAGVDFGAVLRDVAQSFASIAGTLSLITIYVLFMLIEYRRFDYKLAMLLKTKARYRRVTKRVRAIIKDINLYIKMKTFVSLLTGLITYLVLLVLGVDFAPFWGILTFALNYIPNVGSIIAVAFPAMISLVQFDGFSSFFLVVFLLGTIQFSIGSILDPRLMGGTLNLSPLVIILSLAFWGIIWGVVGMFLCVPIMVIVNIVLAEFPKTRPIAILLSHDPTVLEEKR